MDNTGLCKVEQYEKLYSEYENNYTDVSKIKKDLSVQAEEQTKTEKELFSAEKHIKELERNLRIQNDDDIKRSEMGIKRCNNDLKKLLEKQKNELNNEINSTEQGIAAFCKNAVKEISSAIEEQITKRNAKSSEDDDKRKSELEALIGESDKKIGELRKKIPDIKDNIPSLEQIEKDIESFKNEDGELSDYSKTLLKEETKKTLFEKYAERQTEIHKTAKSLDMPRFLSQVDLPSSKEKKTSLTKEVLSVIGRGENNFERITYSLSLRPIVIYSVIAAIIGLIAIFNLISSSENLGVFSGMIGISGALAMLCAMLINNSNDFSEMKSKKTILNVILFGLIAGDAAAIVFLNADFWGTIIGIAIGIVVFGFLLSRLGERETVPLSRDTYLVYYYCKEGRVSEIISLASENMAEEVFEEGTQGNKFICYETSVLENIQEQLSSVIKFKADLDEELKISEKYKNELKLLNEEIDEHGKGFDIEMRQVTANVKKWVAAVSYPEFTYVDAVKAGLNDLQGVDEKRLLSNVKNLDIKYKDLIEKKIALTNDLTAVENGKHRNTPEYAELIKAKKNYEKNIESCGKSDFEKNPEYANAKRKLDKISSSLKNIQNKISNLENKKHDAEEKLMPLKNSVREYMEKTFFSNAQVPTRSKITPYIPLGFSFNSDIDIYKLNYIKHDFKPCIIRYNDDMLENNGLVHFIINGVFGVVINDFDRNKLYKVEIIDQSGRFNQLSNAPIIKKLMQGNYLSYTKESSEATRLLKKLNEARSEIGMSLEEYNRICIEKHRENNIKPYTLLMINEGSSSISSWRDTFIQIVNNAEYWGVIPIIFISDSEYDERNFSDIFKNTINYIELDSFARQRGSDEMRLLLDNIDISEKDYNFKTAGGY